MTWDDARLMADMATQLYRVSQAADRLAMAVERMADSTERMAAAAERALRHYVPESKA